MKLEVRVEEDLRFIRRTMESAGSFTAVPGKGGAAMGLVALATAALAPPPDRPAAWLGTWLAAAAASVAIGLAFMNQKALRAGAPLRAGAGRRFALSLSAPLAAGAALTPLLHASGLTGALPGTWLLLYGAGVIAAGASSIPVVPVMGATFMLAGGLGLLCPPASANGVMALGFGGLHLVFGLLIARRYGG